MENASKALIIAGAILIAILLISIGILVMNSINSPLSQAEEEGKTMAAQMYNSKFISYMGEQKGTKVKELLLLVGSPYFDDGGWNDGQPRVWIEGPMLGGGRYGFGGLTVERVYDIIIDDEIYTVEMGEDEVKPTSNESIHNPAADDGYYDQIIVRGTFENIRKLQ